MGPTARTPTSITDSSFYSSDQLRVGVWPASTSVDQALLYFNLASIPVAATTTVTESHLTVFNTAANGGDGHPTRMYGLGDGGWAFFPGVTWNNQPPTDGKGLRGEFDGIYGANGFGGCGCFVQLDTAPLAKSWLHDSQRNDGLQLTANLGDAESGKMFYAGDAGFYAPRFSVTYFTGPPQATPVWPPNEAQTSSLTPTLTVNNAGAGIQYYFRVATGQDAESGSIIANSGWQNSPNWAVPAGTLRDGGTYYWHAWTSNGTLWTIPDWAWRFTANRRLGTDTPSPYDTSGPVSVNLATGNLITQTKSPTFKTVGGDVGLTYTYNSQQPPGQGLRGSYYNCTTLNCQVDMSSVDPSMFFDWGDVAPGIGIRADNWSARWGGYVKVPQSGTYYFGAAHDDGVRIWVNNTLVVDQWVDGTTNGTPSYGGAVDLTANQPVPITVEYYDHYGPAVLQLWAKGPPGEAPLPPSWLSPEAPALPGGWNVSADLDGKLAYTRVTAYLGAAIFYAEDGTATVFRPIVGPAGVSWAPPPGEDGWVTQTSSGLQLADGDGTIYHFNQFGQLTSTDSSIDDRKNATATYQWAGNPARLQTITDPVSQRQITLTYGGGACGTQPSGFDAVPESMLCKVHYWDDTDTYLRYKNGQFARLEDPGGEVTDFGYGANGLLTVIRDPLAADAVAAGVRADNDITRTLIGYDSATPPRAQSVTLAEPTAGAARPQRSYTYQLGQTGVATAGIAGTRTVTHDERARKLTDTDPTGRTTTTTTWDPIKDQTVATTDAAGLKTGTVYDHADRPTDTYGPAPQGWFNGSAPPPAYTSQVPRTTTRYDEGFNGLGVAYYNDPQLGAPTVAHTLGVNASGAIDVNWGTGSPTAGVNADNWSAQLTGDLTFPQAGIYHFAIASDDGIRLYIDDKLVTDAWGPGSAWRFGDYNNPTAGKTNRIRLDYQDLTGNASLTVTWTPPGGTSEIVPGNLLHPRYGLTTSKTDPDGKTTATQYADPALGLPTATVADPGGLALTTATGYEGIATNQYRRRVSKTLPAGNQWTYQYYGKDTNATRDIPSTCPGSQTGVDQGGAVYKTVAPDPDGAGSQSPRVDEAVYDKAGRTAATRVGSEPWTCTRFDPRGRVTQRVIPAFGGQPARTVNHDYAVNGNPLVTRVSDAAGNVTTGLDLLGRAVSYTDVWGKTTTTAYDQAGRAINTNGPTGAMNTSYDDAGRVTSVSLDNQPIAVPTYDTGGRLDTVSYPSGASNGGNGTNLDPIARDALGRTTGLTWKDINGGTITSDSVTRTLSGKTTDETIDGVDADPNNPNFAYDTAGRLTSAKVPGHTISYSFDPAGGCGPLTTAGKNTNRTAMTDNGIPTTYCYDNADKLASTTAPEHASIAYDSHGNTTTVGVETHRYDGADRHMSTQAGPLTVAYKRDATDRIVARDVTGVNVAPMRYTYTGDGDTADATLDPTNNVIERTISLPGGVLLTKRLGVADVWSYPNIHGDIVSTADSLGLKVPPTTFTYDPYGQGLGVVPDNSLGDYDYGWLGQHQRGLEHQLGIQPIVEMGARQYDPALGRFLEVDPIEGGCANDYTYIFGNPLNQFDLTGTRRGKNPVCRVARLVSPGGHLRAAQKARKGDVRGSIRDTLTSFLATLLLLPLRNIGDLITIAAGGIDALCSIPKPRGRRVDKDELGYEVTREYIRRSNSQDPRFNGQPGGYYNPGQPSP